MADTEAQTPPLLVAGSPAVLENVAADERSQRRREGFRRARKSLVRARWPILALIVLSLVGFAAVLGPSVAPMDPNRQNIIRRLQEPMQPDRAGRTPYLLGTDALG